MNFTLWLLGPAMMVLGPIGIGILARAKQQPGLPWGLLSLIVSWPIGLIALFFAKPRGFKNLSNPFLGFDYRYALAVVLSLTFPAWGPIFLVYVISKLPLIGALITIPFGIMWLCSAWPIIRETEGFGAFIATLVYYGAAFLVTFFAGWGAIMMFPSDSFR